MDFGIGTIFKKKVSEEKVATLFVNNVFNSVDAGFADVTELISNDLQFETPATMDPKDQDAFLMIVITGNYILLEEYFDEGQEDRIRELVLNKLASIYDAQRDSVETAIKEMTAFFSKINYPSKKTIYAMSRAIFFKYDLNRFQKPFFKDKGVPDPVLLKHMDEINEQFLIDWNQFTDKFKITD